MLLRSRRAFTLVELLVGVAIIGVLVALLLPAVQQAREAARRTQCRSNLHQLALALHNYHDVAGQFPLSIQNTGAAPGPAWAASSRGSYFVRLLPQLDQGPLYNLLDFSTVGPPWNPPNFEAQGDAAGLYRHRVIPVFLCPSDTGEVISGHGAKSNYALSLGNQRMDALPTAWGICTLYPGNDFGNGRTSHGNAFQQANPWHPEHLAAQNFSGVVARQNWAARLRDITDGTSNTIAGGEIRPQCGDHTRHGWFHYNSLWVATTAPINFPVVCVGESGWNSPTPAPGMNGCNHWQNWQTSQGFKSRHESGAHFVLCDGSVRFISENIDYMTYQRLGDRRDGEPVGEF